MNVIYSTNEPVMLNCTASSDVDLNIAAKRDCEMIGFNGQCTLARDLPGIEVEIKGNSGPTGRDGNIMVKYSVLITDPDMGYVHLWCCWDLGNGTILEGEHFNLRKIPSDPEDSLGGK